MNRIYAAAGIVFSLVFSTACGDAADKGKDKKADKKEMSHEHDEDFAEQAESPDLVLPGSVHIGELFRSAGLHYMKGITNDPENATNYNTKAEKLLNYGVYSADLTYSAINGRSQEAAAYMNTVKSLGDDIGFSEIFGGEGTLRRFENNMNNQDSVLTLLLEIQQRTDDYIDDNSVTNEALVIFTGAWIEGMYIGVKASDLREQDEVSKRLVEQMAILDNILDGLRPLSKRVESLQPLTDKLQKLNKTFYSIPEVADSKGSAKNVEIGFMDLKKVADQIKSIRNSIV